MSNTPACIAAAVALASLPLAAAALSLAPGETLDTGGYLDFAEVPDGDPEFFGALLGSISESAREAQDGFDVVADLYIVTDFIAVVFASADGGTTSGYSFSSIDDGEAGLTHRVAVFSVSAFVA